MAREKDLFTKGGGGVDRLKEGERRGRQEKSNISQPFVGGCLIAFTPNYYTLLPK